MMKYLNEDGMKEARQPAAASTFFEKKRRNYELLAKEEKETDRESPNQKLKYIQRGLLPL